MLTDRFNVGINAIENHAHLTALTAKELGPKSLLQYTVNLI
jgi:hypothetical protein